MWPIGHGVVCGRKATSECARRHSEPLWPENPEAAPGARLDAGRDGTSVRNGQGLYQSFRARQQERVPSVIGSPGTWIRIDIVKAARGYLAGLTRVLPARARISRSANHAPCRYFLLAAC
jgi:hypothetical protein